MSISSQNLCVVLKTLLIALLLSNASPALLTSVQGQTNSKNDAIVSPPNQNDDLAAFLKNPIDLITFKKKKDRLTAAHLKQALGYTDQKNPASFINTCCLQRQLDTVRVKDLAVSP